MSIMDCQLLRQKFVKQSQQWKHKDCCFQRNDNSKIVHYDISIQGLSSRQLKHIYVFISESIWLTFLQNNWSSRKTRLICLILKYKCAQQWYHWLREIIRLLHLRCRNPTSAFKKPHTITLKNRCLIFSIISI